MTYQILITFLILSGILVALGNSYSYGHDTHAIYKKHPLREIDTLVLYNGKFTAGRRSPPVPQMTCIGGSGQSFQHKVESVHCHNTGFDGRDVIWRCEAELPKIEEGGHLYELKFGKVEVSCEGYDYPDDPFILVDSCGLEYTLNAEQVGISSTRMGYVPSRGYETVNVVSADWEYRSVVLTLVFLLFIIFVIGCMCFDKSPTATHATYTAPRTSTTTRTTYATPLSSTTTRTTYATPETPENQTAEIPTPAPPPAVHTYTHTRETVHVPVDNGASSYRQGYNDANLYNALTRPRVTPVTVTHVPVYVGTAPRSGSVNSGSSGSTTSTATGATKRR